MRTGGYPKDVTNVGSRRNNSIIGGQANRIANDILNMSDKTTKISGTLKVIEPKKSRRLRKCYYKEEFNVALNKENIEPAYLCGRLFAVLERLQQDAAGGSLNRTIKTAYFACIQIYVNTFYLI